MTPDYSRERPVLAISAVPRVIVPLARVLNNHGLTVHGAVLSNREPIYSSAIATFNHLPALTEENAEPLGRAITALIDRYDIGTIIPCGDDGLEALAPLYANLASRGLRFTCPEPEVYQQVLRKEITLEIAEKIGIPVPHSYRLSETDIELRRSQIRFPIIIKPRDKQVEAVTGVRAKRLDSSEELLSFFQGCGHSADGFLMQEFVPGGGVGIEVLMTNEGPHAMFQHRRLREYPAAGGVSVAARSEPVDPELSTLAISLLRALRWQGVAMVEFRQDLKSGRLALMEVNGRFWGSMALSCHAGVKFPLYAWQVANGYLPERAATYRAGVRFRWLQGDVRRLLQVCGMWRSGELPTSHFVKEVGAFGRDFFPPVHDALWSISDPKPALCELRHVLSDTFAAAMRGGLRKILPTRALHWARQVRPLGYRGALSHLLLTSFAGRYAAPKLLPEYVNCILVICHGNILRSPMAEHLLRNELASRNVYGVRVCSAGVVATHGREADPRGCAVAQEFGIDLHDHRAQRLTSDLVRDADVIVVMDYLNYVRVAREFAGTEHKVVLLGAFATGPMRVREIEDPYHGTEADVRVSYTVIRECVRCLAEVLADKVAPPQKR